MGVGPEVEVLDLLYGFLQCCTPSLCGKVCIRSDWKLPKSSKGPRPQITPNGVFRKATLRGVATSTAETEGAGDGMVQATTPIKR